MAAATASQAWAILARHARDEIRPLRLQELCRDNDRVSSLVAVHNNASENANDNNNESRMLLVDLSRQRMTLDTMNHLLRLAAARNLTGFIQTLAWGQNNVNDPIRINHNGGANQPPPSVRSSSSTLSPRRTTQQQQQQSTTDKKQTRFRVEEAKSSAATSAAAASSSSSPTMHLALRAPRGLTMLMANGTNALTEIHREWERIQRLSDSLRRGQLRGYGGHAIRDVVVVGRGVAVMALQFVYDALLHDKTASDAATMMHNTSTTSLSADGGRNRRGGGGGGPARRLLFLSSVDPIAAASVVSDLDPRTTMVITIALRGEEEEEIRVATATLKSWLLQGLLQGSSGSSSKHHLIIHKHMWLVTGNERFAATHSTPESVFLIPEHSQCEAFTTFTAAGLLPLSIIFGWDIVEELLSGAHDLDTHFVESNPRHNLPVLLALTDVWNDAFLGSSGRVVTPFAEAFAAFPAFVAALEAQTCGRMNSSTDHRGIGGATNNSQQQQQIMSIDFAAAERASCSAIVVDGGLQGGYDRTLYQGGRMMNSELVMAMDTQAAANAARTIGRDGANIEDIQANQDAQMCSVFAHADALAFGTEEKAMANGDGNVSSVMSRTESFGSAATRNSTLMVEPTDVADGNRPSVLLMCGKCDAFACGQLLALCEHRAIVKAHLFGVDPFVRTVGSSLRANRTERLKEELHKMFARIAVTGKVEEESVFGGEQVKDVNLSTATILGHYATLMRDQRIYVVKGP